MALVTGISVTRGNGSGTVRVDFGAGVSATEGWRAFKSVTDECGEAAAVVFGSGCGDGLRGCQSLEWRRGDGSGAVGYNGAWSGMVAVGVGGDGVGARCADSGDARSEAVGDAEVVRSGAVVSSGDGVCGAASASVCGGGTVSGAVAGVHSVGGLSQVPAKVLAGRTGCAQELAGFSAGSGVSESGDAVVEELHVSEKTLANRAKRVRKKNRKVRKQALSQGLASGVDREVVPEWRRGVGRPSFGGGYFSGCSAKVQEELRESRARMLIQQNDLATRKARAEAQADVVARNAELKRLNLDAKLKVAQERRFGVGAASGFAETVVSYGLEDVIPVPSLGGGSGEGSGSVSPDSSISVAQVARMEKALCSLAEKNKELQLKNDVLEKRVAGSARNAFFNPESEGVTMAEVKDAMVDVSYPAEWYMSQVSETDQRILAEAGVMF